LAAMPRLKSRYDPHRSDPCAAVLTSAERGCLRRGAWPEAQLTKVLDESLSTDLAAAGTLDARMTERFLMLARYAASLGSDAILFSCSAFGPCIEAVRADLAPLPVRRPNEAMIAEAEAIGGRIALVATFAPTLKTLPAEFPPNVEIEPIYVEGALSALNAGDSKAHDRLVAEALKGRRCAAVVLAQYSLARSASGVRDDGCASADGARSRCPRASPRSARPSWSHTLALDFSDRGRSEIAEGFPRSRAPPFRRCAPGTFGQFVRDVKGSRRRMRKERIA
jgi:hypothetical protein